MKRLLLGMAILALAGGASGQDQVRLVPAEEKARAAFDRAAVDAESAYRETADGILRVFLSRLVDAERATVREGRIEDANRIRRIAKRFGALAQEASKHIDLGGVLPSPGKPPEGLGLEDAITPCREELKAARKAYAVALRAAGDAAAEAMAPVAVLAIRTADLDAANRVKEAERDIARDIRERLRRLSWREYRFRSMDSVLDRLEVRDPGAWRVVDGELIGTSRDGAKVATPAFRFISAVTFRARIVLPSTRNLRIGVGPVNVIFNWELAAQSHFYYRGKRTVVPGHLLIPGREQQITVRQLTRKSIEVLVDGGRAWITHGRLDGAISVYPAVGSTIGIREIRILGVPEEEPGTDDPSHRLR